MKDWDAIYYSAMTRNVHEAKQNITIYFPVSEIINNFSAWISHLESSVYITLSLNQGLKWRRKEKTYSDKSTQKQKEASQIDYSTRETIFYWFFFFCCFRKYWYIANTLDNIISSFKLAQFFYIRSIVTRYLLNALKL